MSEAPWQSPELVSHVRRLLDSYARWLGRELFDRRGTPEDQASRVWHSPRVVVSHGTQDDPVLNYGNAVALELWETDWDTLTQTPSRLTAEPMHRDERATMMDRCRRDGYVDDYRGVRVSRSGRRFRIDEAIVWNVVDENGQPAGQAATFAEWTFLE